MRFQRLVVALALAACWAPTLGAYPARADEPCQFTWPLDTEIGWFQAPKVEDVPNATTLPETLNEALALSLVPLVDAKLPLPPSRTRSGDGPNAGAVTFESVKAGTYQVTIASDGWIDAVQNGAALKATEFTGSRSCAAARKSVRYEVTAGKLIIEISGATGPSIKLAVKPLN